MGDIQEITDALVRFRNARDWEQFHDPKNLAIAIGIEAAELNELFLWKSAEEIGRVDREKVGEELADILAFSLLLAHKYGFDVKQMVLDKIRKNDKKYPVERSRGSARKYDEL